MTTKVSTASSTVAVEGMLKCYTKGLEWYSPPHLTT